MAGGLRITVSAVPLGEFLNLKIPTLAGNANLENHSPMLVRFGRQDEAVPVLLGWFDDDTGQMRQSLCVFGSDRCVDHRVGPNDEWK